MTAQTTRRPALGADPDRADLDPPVGAITAATVPADTMPAKAAAARASRPADAPDLDRGALDRIVQIALAEDLGTGDVTSELFIDRERACRGEVLLKARGVVAGLSVVRAVFETLDAAVEFEALVADGDRLDGSVAPVVLARLAGSARTVLAGERTALNLLGRLSGIATLTRRYVDAVAGTGAVILDTRKTTPGLRALEKHAVRCGGGSNHRMGLFDAVLVKDNHLRLGRDLREGVAELRASGSTLSVEIEAETLAEVETALAAGADRILLDNMSPDTIRAAVALVGGRCALEASGGVTLATVRAIAETGVDFISVGALTHSAPSLDVSLEVMS